MIIVFITVLVASLLSVFSAYLVIAEKDLLNSCIYLALFGVFYALIYFVLLAPDIVLAYIPISSTIVPVVLIVVIKGMKQRYEA
ncbi:MAG: hydrogenase subunit MbhD domain-containing protein [Desulfurococcaceae archaeon]